MSFLKKVSHYLTLSEEKNIISHEQKIQILELIQEEKSSLWFLKILAIIGGICIWIGVILLIASNWFWYPRLVQVLLALMLPLVSLWIGYYFSYKQTELKILGDTFLFLWGILIGATIALIGQIYHLDGSVWGLTQIWLLFVLPLAFLLRMKSLSVLATGLFYVTLWYYTTESRLLWQNSLWNEKYVLAIFTIVSGTLSIWSYILNQFFKGKYQFFFTPLALISLKILFFVLFLGTITEYFNFTGNILLQHILFLGTLGFMMWWSNKEHEILLRHSTFVWLGVYIIWQYFQIFHTYLWAGMVFISTGIVLIWIVYGAIKISHYLDNKKTS